MKKSELRQIIREEIKTITEGGDMILLKSIGMMIDEYTGALYPSPSKSGRNFLQGEIQMGTSDWKKNISKLDTKDKQLVKSLDLQG